MFTHGFFISLLLSASVVNADNKYPATDFQPKVVYQDVDYQHSSTALSSKTSSQGEVSVADSKYPAANFQPEVVYRNDGYKHKKEINKEPVPYTNEEQNAPAENEESSSLVPSLAVLVIAGFVLYNYRVKKSGPAKKAFSQRSAVTNGDSVSGVAKYLETKVVTKPSSVEKYLTSRENINPVSSVSKYLAKKKVSVRLASVTGVEKYLKDRG